MGPKTSVNLSCAAKLNGEMFVFGGSGSYYNKQVTYSYNKSVQFWQKLRSAKLKTVAYNVLVNYEMSFSMVPVELLFSELKKE